MSVYIIIYTYTQHARTHAHTHSVAHCIPYDGSLRCHITFLFIVVLIPTQLIQLARTPVHRYLSHILFCAMSLHVCTCREIVCSSHHLMLLLWLLLLFLFPRYRSLPQSSMIMCSLTLSICHEQNVLFLVFRSLFVRDARGEHDRTEIVHE